MALNTGFQLNLLQCAYKACFHAVKAELLICTNSGTDNIKGNDAIPTSTNWKYQMKQNKLELRQKYSVYVFDLQRKSWSACLPVLTHLTRIFVVTCSLLSTQRHQEEEFIKTQAVACWSCSVSLSRRYGGALGVVAPLKQSSKTLNYEAL